MEIKDFKTDQNLIYHLIDSQNGNLQSAISELVQNSYDANADICEIDFDFQKNSMIVSDNGSGFSNKEEIEVFFGTFGTIHNEDNSQKFGRFRIGRSLIFSLGSSVWYSNNFILHVDIKKEGLVYKIETTENYVKGCKIIIDLYDKEIRYGDIAYSLKNKFRYLINMNVVFNGDIINLYDMAIITQETEDYIFIEDKDGYTSGIGIYNLGIYLNTIYNYPKVNGVLITKKHLKVDLSRSEILNDELWEKCCSFLSEYSDQKKLFKSRIYINKILEMMFLNQIEYKEIKEVPIFREIQKGKKYSFSDLEKSEKPFGFCFYNRSDSKVKLLHDKQKQQGRAIVLEAESLLTPFLTATKINTTSLSDITEAIKKYLSRRNELDELGYISYRSITDKLEDLYSSYMRSINLNYKIVPEEELTSDEKCILRALNLSTSSLIRPGMRRTIFLGETSLLNNNAWTDGISFIALNRDLLNNFKKSKEKLFRIGIILLHEYTHKSGETEVHDNQFYINFHDYLIEPLFSRYTGRLSYGMYYFYEFFWKVYYKELIKQKLRIPTYLK